MDSREHRKISFNPESGITISPAAPGPGLFMGFETSQPRLDQPFLQGILETAIGPIPRVTSGLCRRDRWGSLRMRLAIGRTKYSVDPGLYALGYPDADSPVLVSANYKLSFDVLRSSLPGRHAWILVLDTKGINVWCAAGKGTFGTAELVKRIRVSGLTSLVSHRRVIVPQLGAPGVAAHAVRKQSGFTVCYGPVEARDLGAYLDAGLKATRAMRRKTFTLAERALLIPVEVSLGLRIFLVAIPLVVLLGGFGGPGTWWDNAIHHGLFAALALALAFIAGAVFFPLLLPLIPGRAFSLKGMELGLCTALVLVLLRGTFGASWPTFLEVAGVFLFVPAITAFLAMNFTGASTFTSLSGVKKEMRRALPLEITAGGLGLILWFGSRFTA